MSSTKSIQKIHFIGIGGIGMSGLARLFMHEGNEVSGSDRAPSAITEALEKEGVRFIKEQSATNITDDIDMVVYTEAMSADHPEMVAAKKLGVPMMNYFEALASVANQYYLIAVAGTHGKTTTTAMIIDVLEAAAFDPTAIVGSLRAKTKSNFRAGKSKYFVVEACEYRRDFLHLSPDILVITNIEPEHLDYYRDLADIQDAFHTLAEKVSEDGVVITQSSDPNIRPILEGLSCSVLDYKQQLNLATPMKQPGIHNRLNAAAAKTVGKFLNIADDTIDTAVSEFSGTWRRFEYKGVLNGALIYDDYAHHPTEIIATIAGARELYPDKKLTIVFQPHLYSRTEELFDGFVDALAKADQIIVTHVYDARNVNKQGVDGAALAGAVKKQNQNTTYKEAFTDVIADLQATVTEEEVVIVMGAGDVAEIAQALTK